MDTLFKYDAILIDDDSLVHAMWSYAAKTQGKTIDLHYTPETFMEKISQIDRTTPIYVDSGLKNGVKGEMIAKELFELGFHEIYLATGHDPSHFPEMSWIKAIVGKEPIWK